MKYAFVAAAFVSAVVAAPPAYGTSTVEVTTEVTVTSCAAYVTDCPATDPYASSSVEAFTSVPVAYPSVSSAVYTSSEPAEPTGYPSGGWGEPPAESSPAVYSPPAESSPVVYTTPAEPTTTGGWGEPAPYPSGTTPAATPTGYTATGTAVVYPTPTGWAPVPATGAGSSVQTTGILAAAGALLAFFL